MEARKAISKGVGAKRNSLEAIIFQCSLSGRHCEQVERQRPFADAQQAVANPKEQLLQPCFAIPPALGISESPEELWIKS